MGFLGILEDNKLSHVPATVILDESRVEGTVSSQTQGLKHGTGRSSHIVLVPQPSEDPNDPLNWSSLRKFMIMCITLFGGCIFAATYGPLLNPALFVLSLEFNRPIVDIAVMSATGLLVPGASGALVSASAVKYGKRPVFLISSLLGVIGSIIGSTATTYNTLMAARVFQGFSTAAYESLIISIIGDMYFVHQRGLYMSITQLILGGVSNFSSVIIGFITADLGWKYLFHLCVCFSGVQLVLLFFFCPETQYLRDRRYEIDENVNDNLEGLAEVEKRHQVHLDETADVERTETVTSTRTTHRSTTKKTFSQELKVFTGIYSSENFLKLLLAPFLVCTNLAVLYVVVVSGTITALYVAMAFDLAQIFSVPPYNLTPAGVGNLSLGPFIGGVIGVFVVGAVNDPVIKWCSRKNHGVYEPEYRLLANVFGLVTGAGLIGFGFVAQAGGSVYATATLHGVVLFGILAVTTATGSYALDAYREMSNEIFVAGIIFKNFLFYGFSYFVNDWTATAGPKVVFGTFGGVALGLVLITPIPFVFGKKYRSYWARNNVMVKLGIKTHAEI